MFISWGSLIWKMLHDNVENDNICLKNVLDQRLQIGFSSKFFFSLWIRFENIFNAKSLERLVNIIEKAAKSISIILIAHKPTIKKLEEFNLLNIIKQNPNIEIRPRYDYANFIRLVLKSEVVLTEVGGVVLNATSQQWNWLSQRWYPNFCCKMIIVLIDL